MDMILNVPVLAPVTMITLPDRSGISSTPHLALGGQVSEILCDTDIRQVASSKVMRRLTLILSCAYSHFPCLNIINMYSSDDTSIIARSEDRLFSDRSMSSDHENTLHLDMIRFRATNALVNTMINPRIRGCLLRGGRAMPNFRAVSGGGRG